MGSIIGPANARSFTLAILTLAALIIGACVAFAAPADFSERDLSPPPKAAGGPNRPRHWCAHRPGLCRQRLTAEDSGTAAQEDNDEDTSDDNRPAEPAPAPGLPPALSRASAQNGTLGQAGAAGPERWGSIST